ncbi:MAG: protein-disulfide reductase DsbD [Marinobacterium sp.]|nr:protein-disulfide reductase DsbD [Marinobacterium sp.]
MVIKNLSVVHSLLSRLSVLLLALMLFSLLFTAGSARASLFGANPFASDDGPLDVEQAFVLQSTQQDDGKLLLQWSIADDYYLYRDRMTIEVTADPQDSESDKRADKASTVMLFATQKSAAKEKDDPLFGRVFVYRDQAEVALTLVSTGDSAANAIIAVTYQGCWDDGICYPPVTKEIPVTAVSAAINEAAVAADMQNTATSQPVADTVPVVQQSEHDRFASMLKDSSLVLTLGAFFLAGLALAFTPCVFPMIPILSSIIAGQGDRVTRGHALRYALVYVLSVAVTYTLIGIVAGLSGANLQAAFQTPWIISLFSGVFVLLALSMFGFYDLQIPSSWQTRLSSLSNSQQGGNLAGVAVMGLLSALIVGPCMAAPLAGALIYIGQTGDPLLGGLALFFLGMGMGVPLLVVGASAGQLLPKAGGWMDAVKAFFGVMMLAMAIWMLDRIVPVWTTMLLAATLLVVSAVYMGALDRLPEPSSGWRKLWKGVGVLGLIYGVVLAIGVFAGSQNFLRPLQGLMAGGSTLQEKKLPFNVVTTPAQLELLLAQAHQAGKPAMLDFYADWCISCVELEEFTLKDDAVMKSLQDFMLIKVDVTANGEGAKQLYKRYSVIGPPALIFYDRQGVEQKAMTLVGTVQPEVLVQHVSAL